MQPISKCKSKDMQIYRFPDTSSSTENMSAGTQNATERNCKGIRWMGCGILSQNDVMQHTQLISRGKVLFS